MLEHSYSVGEGVVVFKDPHTTEKREGTATIVKLLDVDNYYDVVFDNDQQVYSRFVFKKE